MPNNIDKPETRIERYLAKAAGADVTTDEPQTRIERYLAAIAQNGGGGGSGGGVFIVTEDPENETLDRTVSEIYAAISSGTPAFKYYQATENSLLVQLITFVSKEDGDYSVGAGSESTPDYTYYVAETEDSYPVRVYD